MKELIAQSRVIAKGNRIRDVQRLVDQYRQTIKVVQEEQPRIRD